jgi:hypothetical protein
MSDVTAIFLMRLLENEENIVEAIRLQLASDDDLSFEQRQTFLCLQIECEGRCDELRSVIAEYKEPTSSASACRSPA